MISSDVYMKSNRTFDRSGNNYRLKYQRHLNYWKTPNRQKISWTLHENILFDKFGNRRAKKKRNFPNNISR